MAISIRNESGVRLLLASACALTLAGCIAPAQRENAPPQTNVRYRAYADVGTPRYEEKEDEVSNRPVTVQNPPPAYPQAAITLGLHRVVVLAKVIVDTEGKVSEVRIAPAADPATHPAMFDDAVHEAMMHWRYIPLTFTRFEEVKDAQGNVVDSRPLSAERKPFSLDYEFVFELRDGKPFVAGGSSR
jgi:hypothetical protein